MPWLNREQIRNRALQLVAQNPGGVRWARIIKAIMTESPETPKNSIVGACLNLDEVFPDKVARPSRGLYQPVAAEAVGPSPARSSPLESAFYGPFAEFLREDLG